LGSILDELIVRKLGTDLAPESINAAAVCICLRLIAGEKVRNYIVKCDETPRSNERRIIIEILLDAFVAVVSVDEQEIDFVIANYFTYAPLGLA
jgi:hypothetical protein